MGGTQVNKFRRVIIDVSHQQRHAQEKLNHDAKKPHPHGGMDTPLEPHLLGVKSLVLPTRSDQTRHIRSSAKKIMRLLPIKPFNFQSLSNDFPL